MQTPDQLTSQDLSQIEFEIDQISNRLSSPWTTEENSLSYERRLDELIKVVESSYKQTRRSEIGLRLIRCLVDTRRLPVQQQVDKIHISLELIQRI